MSLTSMCFLSCLLIAFLFLNFGVEDVHGTQCTRKNSLYDTGNTETFSCPGIFDSSKKAFCCGSMLNRYCCKLSKYHSDSFYDNDSENFKSAGKVVKGIFTLIIVIILVIGGCIVGCCVCGYCMLKKKRVTRGQVLSTDPGQMNAQQPYSQPQQMQAGYAAAPGYPAAASQYPSAASPYPPAQQYPTGDHPPSYPTATGYPEVNKMPPYNPNYPQ